MSECFNCGYTIQIEGLEKEVTSLKEQLQAEMEVVDFYADQLNWRKNSGDPYNESLKGSYTTILFNDVEQSLIRVDYKNQVGGKRARIQQSKRLV